MPDRFLFRNVEHPARLVSYLLIFMALALAAMAVWVILLSGRVSNSEAVKRVEDKAAVGRARLGLQFAQALVDVSICIPVKNLDDLLTGTTLTSMERADRVQAKNRYLEKLAEIQTVAPQVKGCDST